MTTRLPSGEQFRFADFAWKSVSCNELMRCAIAPYKVQEELKLWVKTFKILQSLD